MKIVFTAEAWENYLFWQQNNIKIFERINALIKDVSRTPFSGLGKPEPLRHQLQGFWSRRIDAEHRLVYRVNDGSLTIISLRFHYPVC